MADLLLPLCCFPNVEYFHRLSHAALCYVELWEHYPKQTYRNRYEIYGANGKLGLSIPVEGLKGKKKPFGQLRMEESNWSENHLRSIHSAYRSTPFFEYYIDDIEAVYQQGHKTLQHFNVAALNCCLDLLDLTVNIKYTEGYMGDVPGLISGLQDYKPSQNSIVTEAYFQPFAERHGFIPNLSVLDVLFNLGPEAKGYILRQNF